MANTRKKPRTQPAGTLPRAIAEAAMRVASGEYVAPNDLGGSRKTARAAPVEDQAGTPRDEG